MKVGKHGRKVAGASSQICWGRIWTDFLLTQRHNLSFGLLPCLVTTSSLKQMFWWLDGETLSKEQRDHDFIRLVTLALLRLLK